VKPPFAVVRGTTGGGVAAVWTGVVGGVAARGRVVGVAWGAPWTPACGGRGADGSGASVRPDAVAVGSVVAVRGNVGGGAIVARERRRHGGCRRRVRGGEVVAGSVVVRMIVVGAAAGAVPAAAL
jgi:hypothetical protein